MIEDQSTTVWSQLQNSPDALSLLFDSVKCSWEDVANTRLITRTFSYFLLARCRMNPGLVPGISVSFRV